MSSERTAARVRRAFRSWNWRKSLLIVALMLVSFELVYVAAINVILRTGNLEKRLNSATPDAQVKLEGGWSVWPGRVHLDHIQLRFQDRNVQFSVALDHAVVDVSLLELPTKTVHLERVRGENARYLFRHKVDSPKGLEKRLAQYPKIEGFPDPPVFTEPVKPPLSDEAYNLWTIELEDTDVSVRELWFLEYRFVGQGRARGGFRLQPERDAQTEPCHLDLDGTLSAGPHVVANAFRGTIDAQLDRHDPRKVQGEAIFGKISLRLDLRGDVPNLQASALYADSGDLQIDRGAGALRIETENRHGLWTEGSRVRYTTDGVSVRKHALTVSGAAELEARITQGGKDSRVAISADVPRASLTWRGVPAAIDGPSVRRVRGVLGATADLTQPLRWTSLSGELRALVPELRWLNHPLERPELFRGGNAEASAHIQWSEGKLGTGKLELESERAAFQLLEQPVRLSGRLVTSGTYDTNTKRGELGLLRLELPQVSVDKETLPGGLHIRSERLQWHALPPTRLDGRFVLESETIGSLVPLLISSDILRALAKGLVRLGKTRAVVELKQTPAAWDLRLEEAKSGDLEAFGQLRSEKNAEHPCGRWYVQDGSLSVGIVQSAGETSVEPLVSADWWRERPIAARCAVTKSEKAQRPVAPSARPK